MRQADVLYIAADVAISLRICRSSRAECQHELRDADRHKGVDHHQQQLKYHVLPQLRQLPQAVGQIENEQRRAYRGDNVADSADANHAWD